MSSAGKNLSPGTRPLEPIACVVVPTLNGGKLFGDVLRAVVGQKMPGPFDIVIVDSGSTDGTVEGVESAAKSLPSGVGLTLKKIDKRTFRHGPTRNLGASLSNSKYIAFLTQDALPASPTWLSALVAPMECDVQVAGVFGRHLPYPDAHPVTKRDLNGFFDGFRSDPVVRIHDWNRYNSDVQFRQRLHFYSDNNSCMRRSVWRQIPYPNVRWGEDQLWARRILEHGYAKAYADDAAVYHSHDFGFREAILRGRDEMGFWEEFFRYDGVRDLKTVLRFAYDFGQHDVKWLATVPREVAKPLSLQNKIQIFARQFARFYGEYQGRKYIRQQQSAAISAAENARQSLLRERTH